MSTLSLHTPQCAAANEKPSVEQCSTSSSNSNNRLTPEEGSEEGSEEEKEEEEGLASAGPQHSYRLQSKGTQMDVEKGGASKDEAEMDEESSEDEDKGVYSSTTRRRASVSTTQSHPLYTPDEERKVIRKFDRRLVLFVAFLYMLSFLDRSNIGNARIAGLEHDLHMTSDQFEWLLQGFYVAYIAFEWLSVLWRTVPAHIYICAIVMSWGVVASLQSVQTSFAGLLGMRIFLGVGEAGFAGIPIYLSYFFKREELALRTGYFISAAPLATSFASSLAWAIIKLGSKIPIAPWRLLLLVEGFPAILVAVLAFRIIPDSPSKACYLSRREKKIASLRLRQEATSLKRKGPPPTSLQDLRSTISDPKNHLTALMFFLTNMSVASMPVFLPTIIQSMGHTPVVAQALSVPPYILSFLIVLLTAYFSDRLQSRSIFVIFHSLLSCLGYLALALAGAYDLNSWFRYAAIFPAAVGFFSVMTIVITWSINNSENEGRKGWGFAMLQIVGQCGPLVGTKVYPKSDGPHYVKGLVVCAAAMLGTAILAGMLRWYLNSKNRVIEDGYGRIGEEAGQELVTKGRGQKRLPFKYMT